MEAGEKYLDCQDRQLTTVMQDWPKDIHHLLLGRNKIQVCRDNFANLHCANIKRQDADHLLQSTYKTQILRMSGRVLCINFLCVNVSSLLL